MEFEPIITIRAEDLRTHYPSLVDVIRRQQEQAEADAYADELVSLGVPEYIARPVTLGEYERVARAAGVPEAEIEYVIDTTAAHLQRILDMREF